MMLNTTLPLFLIALLLLSSGAYAAGSSVTVIEPTPNQTHIIQNSSSNQTEAQYKASLPTLRISQGDCVEIGRYYDISGVIGWSTQFSYYGKYDTELSPSNGSYDMQKIIDHPTNREGLWKYFIDPTIFGNSEGMWYQVSNIQNARGEWAGNLQAFKVQSYCPEQNPETTKKVQQNESVNVSEGLPLPVKTVSDILVVRGDSIAYNNSKITKGSRMWIFGIDTGIYNLTGINETLVLSSVQTRSLSEGRYHIIIDSPGKNTLIEAAYNNNTVTSPIKGTPDLDLHGISPQVAYGKFVDWMWKYSDDELTLVDMQVQNPYIDIYSIETTNVNEHSGLTIKGYTNLQAHSIVYSAIDEDRYGNLVTKSYGVVIGDTIGNMRQFVIKSDVDINDFVSGKAIYVTVHGEHDAIATAPFYVYNIPEGAPVPTQYNKYIGGNLYVPTPTPEIITLPSPTPEIVVQTVTVTIPVPPPQESVDEAQRKATEWVALLGVSIVFGIVFAGYIISLFLRRER